ncbi:DUF456 domain-containing protein [Massilibacteroides sp.]|uniref:DUF456 domain-containing protein n=1 Tax=Massilibacteroides sp. TaxID=2034766 RepID=UPI00262BE7B5|nr:DUF456 domain-containing protein [Massilibacteroides sp.]MDD4515015.1 DUF456 domain-containing protein [Massilibacteroides sp.]
MVLDILLISLGVIFMLIGIIGCIAPMLPGIPLSYIGILLLHFTSEVQFSTEFLIFWGVMVVIIQLLDYYIPIWGTQKLGGGSKGAWGSTVGVVAGMFLFPPLGIIIFPFVGAVIGELLDEKDFKTALKAGFGAFLGFVAGTLMKLAVAIILTFYFIREVVRIFIE